MWKPLIRCSIVGGLVVFLWSMFSWMVLPMHKTQMHRFVDASQVESTILRYAPVDGIYVIPTFEETQGGLKGKDAPFIFVNVKRGVEVSSMTSSMVIGIITQMVGAFLITYLLLHSKVMKYWGRVGFVTIVGILIAILGLIPPWNWWHFPGSWVLLDTFDVVVGWFIGGLVIAKLVKN